MHRKAPGIPGPPSVPASRGAALFSPALWMTVLLGSPAWAQVQEPSPVRESWTLLAPVQFQDVVSLFVRDGHLVWMERKLDPTTERFRAQAHWYRLYRSALGAPGVAELHAPERPSTHRESCVAGPEGAVVWHHSGRDAQLFFPGRAPVPFKGDRPDHSIDTPLRITQDGLLCRTRFGTECGVAWIPLRGGDPDYARRQEVLSWKEDRRQDCEFECDFFADGGHVAYTRRPRAKTDPPVGPSTVLYDLSADREVWTARGWPVGMDGIHVFQTPRLWAYAVTELWRRRRDGTGDGDRLALPWKHVHIIDFRPPHLLALFYEEGDPVAGHLDIDAGTFREFDWSPSSRVHASRRFHVLTESLHVGRHPVGGDARAGVLVVATRDGIHRVPWRGEARALPLRWSPGELK